MKKITPTDKIFACANEAVELWESVGEMVKELSAIVREERSGPDLYNSLMALIAGCIHGRPEQSYLYRHEYESGKSARAASRTYNYRQKKKAEEAEKERLAAEAAKLISTSNFALHPKLGPLLVEWLENNGPAEVFEAHAGEILTAVANGRTVAALVGELA